MNTENNNEVNNIKVEENTKPKRNWKFTLFACIATAIIVALSYNIGNKLAKGTESSKGNSGNNVEITSNSNETSNVTSNETSNVTSEANQNNNNQNDNITETKTNSLIMFDSSKSINSSEKDYKLACQGNAGMWVTVDSTQKSLTFSFSPTKVVEFYSLNWKSDRTDEKKSKINFDKKIVDVFFGGMGQGSSGDTLFILLEDGTVEYIPIVHMFNHTQAEVVSYGKINGVSDVAKFSVSSTSGGVTTLAIKNDGSFYDLSYSLKDTGNY